jgi:hypothetical protein
MEDLYKLSHQEISFGQARALDNMKDMNNLDADIAG